MRLRWHIWKPLRVPYFLFFACIQITNGKEPPKITNLELSTEEGFRIYQHWTEQALTALMSAFLQAKINANELPRELPVTFTKCYRQNNALPSTAKCVSRLLNNGFVENNEKVVLIKRRLQKYKEPERNGRRKNMENGQKQEWIGQFQVEGMPSGEDKRSKKIIDHPEEVENNNGNWPIWMLGIKPKKEQIKEAYRRRFKRSPTLKETTSELDIAKPPMAQSGYQLFDSKRTFGLSPIGGVARLLMANELGRKKRTEKRPWQKTVYEIEKMRDNLAKNKLISDGHEQFEDGQKLPSLRQNGQFGDQLGMPKMLKNMPLLSEEATVGRRKMGGEKPIEEQISDLVRDGIRLGIRLANSKNARTDEGNGTKIDSENEGRLRKRNEGHGEEERDEEEEEAVENGIGTDTGMEVLSPRFLSITEMKSAKNKKSNLYSPSLFSLHNKGTGMERELSLPNLMKGSQFTGRDQQEWMDLIMEASGVNQQVDQMKELLSTAVRKKPIANNGANDGEEEEEISNETARRYKREFKGLYLTKDNVGQMFGDFEERKIDTWAKLERKFTPKQREEMNQTGYSLLNREQLALVYGPTSPFNHSKALQRLMPLMDKEEANASLINGLIERDIHRMAEMRSFDIRQNDVVLSPAVFSSVFIENSDFTSQSFILSPAVFSPTIRSPTIFGPAILSPSVFSPGILSPRLMSPLILSPFIFSTLILSPIVMQPYILSPGVINGVILSPFLMNPLILSPQVMHPFILSPLVMTPGILNPNLLSPLVLSPFIMNPQIFSPKALGGLFLSPYSLSPVVQSPVFYYFVVLSPSILS